MCQKCNNEITQPCDYAWDYFLKSLRACQPKISPGAIIRANRIFRCDTSKFMLNVHLYFVKAFGCVVRAGMDLDSNSIDLSGFSKAILERRNHPDLYIRFDCMPSPNNLVMVSSSDLNIMSDRTSGACDLATWFYNVDGICAVVAFAPDSDIWARKEHFWHPRHGTNKLIIGDFSK